LIRLRMKLGDASACSSFSDLSKKIVPNTASQDHAVGASMV
jgi:hypothetical protein